jgi:hypothetical protein
LESMAALRALRDEDLMELVSEERCEVFDE